MRKLWHCTTCFHRWQDDADKHYKTCVKCDDKFIMEWDLESEEINTKH